MRWRGRERLTQQDTQTSGWTDETKTTATKKLNFLLLLFFLSPFEGASRLRARQLIIRNALRCPALHTRVKAAAIEQRKVEGTLAKGYGMTMTTAAAPQQ